MKNKRQTIFLVLAICIILGYTAILILTAAFNSKKKDPFNGEKTYIEVQIEDRITE